MKDYLLFKKLILPLFNSKETYLKEPVQNQEREVSTAVKMSWLFKGLETGTYAVSAVCDEDNNGKLKPGFLGIPAGLNRDNPCSTNATSMKTLFEFFLR